MADSDRQLALQRKEEVEAQVKQLQEELEGLGLLSSLPGLRSCGDIGSIPLPKLHSLQTQLRLDLEAVDGVSLGRQWQLGVCPLRGREGLRLPYMASPSPYQPTVWSQLPA